MVISLVITYLTFAFDVKYKIDLTLISIAVIFPLVFTIRGSFRRREKALEHLSQFRGCLKSMHYLISADPKLSEENKLALSNILIEISETTINHLKRDDYNTNELDATLHKVLIFIKDNYETFPKSLRDRILRLMENLHESVENLHAIHVHRTPISLKAYCKVFIYFFPLIYAPTLISTIGEDAQQWATYFIVIITEFILISLYNIQDHLEYPFDNKGLDDIKLDLFKIDR